MMQCNEQVINTLPVIIRRRVRWLECDPAGVVFTGIFSDYAISAAEWFYEVLLGESSQKAKRVHGFGTPTRALTFDFKRSLKPDEVFDLLVTVEEIHTRTYVLNITGQTLDNEIVFISKLTPVCIAVDERRSIDIPPTFRLALEQYQRQCLSKSLAKEN